MPRPPMPLNSWGEFSYETLSTGQTQARARFRGLDGVIRQVKVSDSTRARARRKLEHRLQTLKGSGGTIAELTDLSTVADLVNSWLEAVDRSDRRDQTVRGYKSVVSQHVLPRFGSLRIAEATTAVVEHHVQQMVEEGRNGVGRSTARRCRAVLSMVFKHGLRLGVVNFDPTIGLSRLPKPRRHDRMRLEADDISEIRQLLVDAEARTYVNDVGEVIRRSGPPTANSWNDILILMIGSGMRIGEVLATRWTDIQLDGAVPTLTVCGTVLDSPPRRQPVPKTSSSHRRLILPDFVVEMLLIRRSLETTIDGETLVFHTRTGTPVVASNLRRTWRRALADSPYSDVHPHDLRAAVATAIDEQRGTGQASDVLGHAEESTTSIYLVKASMAPDVRDVLSSLWPGE